MSEIAAAQAAAGLTPALFEAFAEVYSPRSAARSLGALEPEQVDPTVRARGPPRPALSCRPPDDAPSQVDARTLW